MVQRKLSLILLTAFVMLFSLATVSAVTYSISDSSLELSRAVNNTSFTISTTSTTGVQVVIPNFVSITDSEGNIIQLVTSGSGTVTVTDTTPKTVNVSYASLPSNIALGSFSKSISLSIVNVSNTADNTTQAVTTTFINGFCEFGDASDSVRSLEIVSIKDQSSDDDFEWRPLDDVEIAVKVKFNNEDDSDDEIDAIVELGLYDTETKDFIELDDEDTLEEDISLEEGNSEEVIFNVKVPIDIEDSADRYRIYAKVYEEDSEDELCNDEEDNEYFKDVKISKESYDVIINNIDLASAGSVPCGQTVELTARVYNIGSNDEDKVFVNLYSQELGIDLDSGEFSLDADGDEEDYKTVSFNFVVPRNITEGTYNLKLYAHFKYKDSTETYGRESDAFTTSLAVDGNCVGSGERNVSLNVNLNEETPRAKIGKQVIVDVELENTGEETTTYTLTVLGVSEWAEVADIDPETITLEKDEEGVVSVYLDIDSEVEEGEQEFTIKVAYGGEEKSQKVLINLEKGWSGSAFIENIKKNWFVYLIILVNIILIIAIIVIIARMVSREDSD